jgi:hypothetical protein
MKKKVNEVAMGPSDNGWFAWLFQNIGQALDKLPSDAEIDQKTTDGRRGFPDERDALRMKIQRLRKAVAPHEANRPDDPMSDESTQWFDKYMDLTGQILDARKQIVAKTLGTDGATDKLDDLKRRAGIGKYNN